MYLVVELVGDPTHFGFFLNQLIRSAERMVEADFVLAFTRLGMPFISHIMKLTVGPCIPVFKYICSMC